MASSPKLSLKLLIDQTTNRVVFAEAGKETIDFLFSILTLPVGSIIRLLSKQGMVGGLANLYQSVKNLKDEYILPKLNKDVLLKPNTCSSTQEIPLFAINKRKPETKLYVCSQSTCNGHSPFHTYVTVDSGTACPSPGCTCSLNEEVSLYGDIKEETVVNVGGGFVKGEVTYMVMDDLVGKPLSTISSVVLLKKLKVKGVDALEQKIVDLNMDMGLKLLRTAFRSKEVLTSVFLR